MGKALWVILVAVIGCVLVAIVVLAWNLSDPFYRPELSDSGSEALRLFTDRSTKALGAFHDPDEDSGALIVQIFFLPPGVRLTDLRVTGVDVRARVRADMRGYCNPPCNCDTVSFMGHQQAGASPAAAYKGVSFPLLQEAGGKGTKSSPLFWWNDLNVPFYNSHSGITDSFSEPQIPEACARAFKPTPGVRIADVWATGRPAFELDRFLNGLWAGSYVVWRTEAEARAGDLTKTPASN